MTVFLLYYRHNEEVNMILKTIQTDKLTRIIKKHNNWLENKWHLPWNQKCADLSNMDLQNANLAGLNLSHINLSNTDLTNVSLRGTILHRANLSGAILKNVDLSGAILMNASLNNTILDNVNAHGLRAAAANFKNAKIANTNFTNASFVGSQFSDAVLDTLDISGANFYGAELNTQQQTKITRSATTKWFDMICPATGEFTIYKRCQNDRIVELCVLADAKRVVGTTPKCRVSAAKVVKITSLDGNTEYKYAFSLFDSDFIYIKNDVVTVENFEPSRWIECASGIHGFLHRELAVAYGTYSFYKVLNNILSNEPG